MRQSEFDFPKLYEREKLLVELPLESQLVTGTTVSPRVLSSVLQVISRFPECWYSQPRIAKECRVSPRTVMRAIGCLKKLNLITSDRKWNEVADRVLNHHRIVWQEVRDRCRAAKKAATTSEMTADQSDYLPSDSDNSPTTKVTIEPDQSDYQVPSNVTISHLPGDYQSPVLNKGTKETTSTSETAAWVEVVSDLFYWGMAEAELACQAAYGSGLTVEQVRELQQLADKCGERFAPAKLYKWLTGAETPPADPAAKIPKSAASDEERAESIRYEAISEGRRRLTSNGVPWIDDPRVLAVTAKRLVAAGLTEQLTEPELETLSMERV